jgi:hypothetical protein
MRLFQSLALQREHLSGLRADVTVEPRHLLHTLVADVDTIETTLPQHVMAKRVYEGLWLALVPLPADDADAGRKL